MIPKDKAKRKQRLEFVHPFWKAGADVKQISPANVVLGRRKKNTIHRKKNIHSEFSGRGKTYTHGIHPSLLILAKEEQIKKRVHCFLLVLVLVLHSKLHSSVLIQFSK
ncbi:hypothetical protein CEXT_734881 [Caerostris extrusa]|uniref:Uncharacterized protein n=1 Tax=Caerostris extrusa TaxID=172846 RepID=A0AAV4N937_CAEEX|nr:hypothetical protein CEXT_734881 [Caerostris extrusa]